ncbi:MAG: hypothetical protein AB8B97_06635 [Granulosicoccus sp.]
MPSHNGKPHSKNDTIEVLRFIAAFYYVLTLGVFFIAMALPSLLKSTTADPAHLFMSLLFIPFDKHGTGHVASLLSIDIPGERFIYAAIPSMVVIGLALIVFDGRSMPRLLVALGGASYVLYLTHPYVIQVFDKFTGWFAGGPVQQWLALGLLVVIANALALALYQYLEVPLRAQLRKRLLH